MKSLQPGNGYQLPRYAYYTREWYEREQEKLFPCTWNFVCTLQDVAESGSYFTTTIGDYPLAVVRDTDGELRCFHNTCRHRGAAILDGQGTADRIRCPYHFWQYGLDGSLQNVPQLDRQFGNFDTADYALKEARLATWMNMVFINPDGQAADLKSFLGPLPDHLGAFNVQELTELGSSEYIFDANWKFYVENHIDWYHLWYTHYQTLSMLRPHDGLWSQAGPHWYSFAPFRENVDYHEPFEDLPDLSSVQRWVGAHLVFPNLPLFSGAGWFGTGLLTPLSPGRTKMTFRLWGLPGQSADEFLESFHQITQVEDANMASRLQQAVRSPAFEVGPLARTYEEPITQFHDAYLAVLDDNNSPR